MTDKKELNNEELNKVAGGTSSYDRFEELNKIYSQIIDKYQTEQHINEMLLIINKYSYHYYLGRIIKSFEKSSTCGTERTITLEVIESSIEDKTGKTIDIGLDKFDCYLSN